MPSFDEGSFIFATSGETSSTDSAASDGAPIHAADPGAILAANGASGASPNVPAKRALAASAEPRATATIVLPGTGTTESMAANCAPRLYDDFIDSGSWNKRRLLPRDCLLVQTTAPVFSWLQPSDRNTALPWTLSLRRSGSASLHATFSTDVPRLALHQGLPAGDFEWTVSYLTKAGKTVTSATRRFTVDGNARKLVFPSGEQLTASVASKAQPRVLPAGTTFTGIAAATQANGLAPIHTSLIVTADQALTTDLPTAPDGGSTSSRAKSLTQKLDSTALRKALDQEQRFIEALGYAARTTADTRYRDAGIARALALAAWSPTGETSESNFDYANRSIYLTLANSLDWYAGWLTPSQIASIVAPLEKRLGQAIARFAPLDEQPYNSHVDIIVWSVLEALMHSVGTPGFERAAPWLGYTWELLLTTANIWGADDGGFGNGVAYAWYRMDHIGRTLAAIRVIAGVNLAEHPSIAHLGDFLIASTAPRGSQRGAFGDGAEVTTHFANYAANQFKLYAALTGSPLHNWYASMDKDPFRKGRVFSPWHLMLAGLGISATAGAPPAKDAWLFSDVGVAALHSNSAATDRSSVYFRSSEFGSATHAHADQNAFTFVSHGKDLLISGGYYPYFLSPHHALVTRSTRFKNALTLDGGIGQAEESAGTPTAPGKPMQSRDARGQIINFGETATWAASTGDATLAYRSYNSTNKSWTPLLSEALRTVAYNAAERVLVVYDFAASEQPRRWELNFNALEAFTLNGQTARVTNGRASACIDIHALPGQFALSRGFPLAPENGAPDQFQARFSARSSSNRLTALTVIREDCRAVPVSVSVGDNGDATVSVNGGAPVTFDKRVVTLN